MSTETTVGHPAQPEREHVIHVSVLIDGIPEDRVFRADQTVESVIKELLGGRHADWQQYQLVDQRLGMQPLADSLTLEAAGVRTGDILAFGKRHGGGGAS